MLRRMSALSALLMLSSTFAHASSNYTVPSSAGKCKRCFVQYWAVTEQTCLLIGLTRAAGLAELPVAAAAEAAEMPEAVGRKLRGLAEVLLAAGLPATTV